MNDNDDMKNNRTLEMQIRMCCLQEHVKVGKGR